MRTAWRWSQARWYRRWTIDLALILFAFWVVGRIQSRNLLDDDTVAPAFTLPDLDGVRHALADYRGKTVVLQFFAPWCGVCRFESDNWARIQSWRSDVQVIAVALDWRDPAAVRDFIGDDRGAYPVLLGTDAVQRAYHVESFPSHYIIDPDGRVSWQGEGYTPTVGLWLRLL
ncbi:MAG: TlpA disulfide reductase family protein [Myxococcota bacterium]